MRKFINIVESVASPANLLIQWASAHKPQGMELQLCNTALDDNEPDADTVGIQWIERTTGAVGLAGGFLDQLCTQADALGVTLELGVQYASDDDDDDDDADDYPDEDEDEDDRPDPYRLVGFYTGFGFDETEDDGEFINMRRDPEA